MTSVQATRWERAAWPSGGQRDQNPVPYRGPTGDRPRSRRDGARMHHLRSRQRCRLRHAVCAQALRRFSGCIPQTSSKAPGSVSPTSDGSSNGTGGARGPKGPLTTAPRSFSHCHSLEVIPMVTELRRSSRGGRLVWLGPRASRLWLKPHHVRRTTTARACLPAATLTEMLGRG